MNVTKIPILIKKASLVFDKISNQLLTPYDLTNSQFKILMVLYHTPEDTVRQIDIENKFAMPNPTMTVWEISLAPDSPSVAGLAS